MDNAEPAQHADAAPTTDVPSRFQRLTKKQRRQMEKLTSKSHRSPEAIVFVAVILVIAAAFAIHQVFPGRGSVEATDHAFFNENDHQEE